LSWPKPKILIQEIATNKKYGRAFEPQFKDKAVAKLKELNVEVVKYRLGRAPYPDWQYYTEDTYARKTYCDPIDPPSIPAFTYPDQHRNKWRRFCPHTTTETKPGLMDYFKTTEDRMVFKVTSTLYGRFLTEHFSDVLTAEQIRDLGTEFNAMNDPNDLLWANTPEEIQWVFERGTFASCASSKQDPVHQAQVYAQGDISIAYLLDKLNPERVIARAICWPEKKLIAGVYGDTIRMKTKLAALGYTHIKDRSEMDGAKLKKIVYNGYYIGAHIDYFPDFVDKGEYLEALAGSGQGFYLYRSKPKTGKAIPPGGLWVDEAGNEIDNGLTEKAA